MFSLQATFLGLGAQVAGARMSEKGRQALLMSSLLMCDLAASCRLASFGLDNVGACYVAALHLRFQQ